MMRRSLVKAGQEERSSSATIAPYSFWLCSVARVPLLSEFRPLELLDQCLLPKSACGMPF
jgi:hypothetical protein